MHSTRFRSLALAAGALSALACMPAAAGDNFLVEAHGTSQVIEVINAVGPVLRFGTATTGDGSFGPVSYLSTDVIDMSTGAGSGTSRFVFPSGDELFGAFNVQLFPGTTPGTLALQGLTQFTGGTGLFAGATGSATLKGTGFFTSDTQASVSFTHIGEITVVPEPGTSALLLAGLGAVGSLVRRRREAAAPRVVGAKAGPLHFSPSKGE